MLIQSKASLKFVSIPPRKMRLVASTVKGLPVERALNILNYTPRVAAGHVAKTVKSAAANALSQEGTDHLKPEALIVKNIFVDSAPTAKRIRFQSMGRVFRIRKRFCHLTVILEGRTDMEAATNPTKGKAKASEGDQHDDKVSERKARKVARKTASKSDKESKKSPAPKRVKAKPAGAATVRKSGGGRGEK
ncbi:MAG: 50S ribosomal protein L22 [Candidatus Zixiibacteriota bacterium]